MFKKIVGHIKDDDARIHNEVLPEHNGISTAWALGASDNHPGFFTPFASNSVTNYIYEQYFSRARPAGIKQAAITVGLLPALQLQTALTSALWASCHLLDSMSSAVNGDFEQYLYKTKYAVGFTCSAVYFTGAFVINLLKEVTAFITRSIATLVEMGMNLFDEDRRTEDEDMSYIFRT